MVQGDYLTMSYLYHLYVLSLLLLFSSPLPGLKTPLDMKLQLLPVMREMCHSLATATQVSSGIDLRNYLSHPLCLSSLQVREVSLQLLQSYPSLSFVTTIIDTLTHLAIATLVQVPDQVKMIIILTGTS